MPIARKQVANVGMAPVMIYKVDDTILNETQTVWGMTFANVIGVDVAVSMYIISPRDGQAFVMKGVAIPANNVIGLGEDSFNFVLVPGDSLWVYSDTGGSVDVTLTTRNYV